MYTKFMLTVIALCLIGINFYLFGNFAITDAEAAGLGRFQILKLIDLNCYVNGSDIICATSNLKF